MNTPRSGAPAPPPIREERFDWPPAHNEWRFIARQGPIMKSCCSCTSPSSTNGVATECSFCLFEHSLELPQRPDMIFSDSSLELTHVGSGAVIRFDALDALRGVDATRDDPTLKVFASEEWLAARKDVMKGVAKPFDWTFTSAYAGSLKGVQIVPSETRIDLERLRVREPILFYDELTLFEDELGDNGCSRLTVKFRAMPSCFFLLARQYVRVDHVMVRVCDTRIFAEAGGRELIRERARRERRIGELPSDAAMRAVVMSADEVGQHLTLVEERVEKLVL